MASGGSCRSGQSRPRRLRQLRCRTAARGRDSPARHPPADPAIAGRL